MVRVLSRGLVFIVLAVATPRDSLNLHTRYGQPDLERFTIRPDITLTVEYGPDGKACVTNIEPRQAFIHETYFPLPTMTEETAQSLLSEVAPPETRGKGSEEIGFQSSRNVIRTFAYEKVTINLHVDVSPTEGGVRDAWVDFKRAECSSGFK
jgi:hypothetical protein